MKLLLILVMMIFVNLFQNIDSKRYRILVQDNLLPHIDKSIPFVSEFFSLENLIFEQIDDDNVQIGGYLEAKKSMDRNLPLLVDIRTQAFERAIWNEGQFRMTLPSMCHEFSNPTRFWYNITKLWTSDLCPAKAGDKWNIESGPINIIQELPPTLPVVPWRGYTVASQGFPGFEKFKFGFGVEIHFVLI